jgi:hypothetical protein
MDQGRSIELEVLRRMSPAEKLTVMTGLIRQAYRLKAAWIRAMEPDLSDEEVHLRLLEAMGRDRS